MNLVLIGVMGSGKTTVGRLLAKRLKMRFVDMDKEIEKRHGPIPFLFEMKGEEAFRNMESDLAEELASEEGLVISTGGGIVKRPANTAALHRNGLILYLDRPLEEIQKTLNVNHRPLLKDNPDKLRDILVEREPLYRAQSDVRIDASGTLRSTVSRALSAWRRELSARMQY